MKQPILPITNAYMFAKVFKDKELCKEMLERLLQIKIERLEDPRPESVQQGFLEKKSVRFDVFVKEASGQERIFDIELQMQNSGELPQRARYYSSMLSMVDLDKGDAYSLLRESFVIFLCPTDPFGYEKSIYHFEYRDKNDPSIKLGDFSHIFFYIFNKYSEIGDENAKHFLEYLATNTPNDEFSEKLNRRLAKEQPDPDTWRSLMTVEDEIKFNYWMGVKKGGIEGRAEGRAEGVVEGEARGKLAGKLEGILETAKKMLSLGEPEDKVALFTGLSVAQLKTLL